MNIKSKIKTNIEEIFFNSDQQLHKMTANFNSLIFLLSKLIDNISDFVNFYYFVPNKLEYKKRMFYSNKNGIRMLLNINKLVI